MTDTPLTDAEALEEIRRLWLMWAKGGLEADDVMGPIAGALERSGRPVIDG